MAINIDDLYSNLLIDIDKVLPTGAPYPESPPWHYACIALRDSFTKKFLDEVSDDADELALEKFLASNQQCREWRYAPQTTLDDLLIGHFKEEFRKFSELFVSCSSYDIWIAAKCGPGASLGTRYKDSYGKMYESDLSCTSSALIRIHNYYSSLDPRKAVANYMRTQSFGKGTVVDGSKLTFVPKNNDISRVIAVEPTLNMYFQQGLRAIMEEALKKAFNINLSTQPDFNANLARLGSITNDLSTIDLSSASDSVSLAMLDTLFPSDPLIGWCKAFRSPGITLPSGRYEELAMISSMGNASTFPLETAIFASCVRAVYALNGFPFKGGPKGTYGVFGDDIICLEKSSRQVLRLLQLLGFTPNKEKTFITGKFRESCGADYWSGYPVRGVYCKRLKSVEDRYSVINRLMEWQYLHNISLPETMKYLKCSVPLHYVPMFENIDAGIRVPLELSGSKLRPHPILGYGYAYTRHIARPVKLRVGCNAMLNSKRLYNPYGLLLEFLRGNIRDCTIGVRTPNVLYNKRKAYTTDWNFQLEDKRFCLARYVSLCSAIGLGQLPKVRPAVR